MKTRFVEVTQAELAITAEKWICERCCHVGTSACRRVKCKPRERCDKKQGYYVEEKEVAP